MRQFDVYENPSSKTRSVAPYFLVLSSHLLGGLASVVVAPLVGDRAYAMRDLEPQFEIEGQTLILGLTELSSMEIRNLRNRIGSLADEEDAIRRALDRLFTGF